MFLFCVSYFALFFSSYIRKINAEDKETYLEKRRTLLQEEWEMTTGGGVVLNKDELKVNTFLMNLKGAEVNEAAKPDGYFPPAHNFMAAKSRIEESDVFKFIRKMPKGKFSFSILQIDFTTRHTLFVCSGVVKNRLGLWNAFPFTKILTHCLRYFSDITINNREIIS